jgi:hypothetical protein
MPSPKVIASIALALLVSVGADAQTQTHQLRDTTGKCLTNSLALLTCDGSPTQSWSYEAQQAAAPVGLFPTDATPGTVAENDPHAVVLGMKFLVNADGKISGLRFYKSAQNTGTHVGDLWDAQGKNLATVTFANETASGWQKADFATPVNITAGTTYTVSYHTTTGHYAGDEGYFNAAKTNNGITAPANAGVFVYGANAYPNETWNHSNYWVDVQYNPGVSVPINGACGSANGVPVSSAPSQNLCSAGTASAVTGAGPWNWSCNGSGGGTNASCSAPKATIPPSQSTLLLGVNSPYDTSIQPRPMWVEGPDGQGFQAWTIPEDYAYWEKSIGYPAGSIASSGAGIAMDPDPSRGPWDNYEGSAWTMVQWMYTQGRGADKLWLNIPPFPQHLGMKLPEVATGAYDEHYRKVAAQLMDHGYDKIVWRPIWEFEGGWYEWGWKSGHQNGPTYCTDYIAAFRRMVQVIRSVMPEAKFAFNAADGTIMTPNNGAPEGWQACYPGDDDTDFVAIDTYDGLRSRTTPAETRWQQDQVPGIRDSQALALAHHKGWAVPEWAQGDMGDNPLYVKNMHDAAVAFMAHGLPAMLGYWNSGDPASGYAGYMNTDHNPQSWAEFTKDFHVQRKGRIIYH